MALFQTRFVLIEEDGWRKNWYPNNKTFIKKDEHSPATVSLNFSNSDELILPRADQSILYCLGVPLGMICKAVLTENRVIVTEIRPGVRESKENPNL